MCPAMRKNPCISEKFHTKTGPIEAQRCETKWKKSKMEENRRIVLEILDEEKDLGYYSDWNSDSDYEYQTYV